ncbi:hypothetical protein GN958_ATG06334 [Phytophthora infestans]|uniref:Uncharacterized protein n=1 Tax=Phytophthora infestans TaxID=4787 RepID=A0A8S9UU12_PHYIN|nr:hypothetical protein GN958_ATG06334 [Phytophthora infestans]
MRCTRGFHKPLKLPNDDQHDVNYLNTESLQSGLLSPTVKIERELDDFVDLRDKVYSGMFLAHSAQYCKLCSVELDAVVNGVDSGGVTFTLFGVKRVMCKLSKFTKYLLRCTVQLMLKVVASHKFWFLKRCTLSCSHQAQPRYHTNTNYSPSPLMFAISTERNRAQREDRSLTPYHSLCPHVVTREDITPHFIAHSSIREQQTTTFSTRQLDMKTAAAFATFLALSLFVSTNEVQATPALRGLRSNADDSQATEDDESRKDHHHHVKVVKKVKKIAIPVPVAVEVPQFIPVPISAPSAVIASSNNAIVSSNNNAVAAPGPGAVGPGAPGAPGPGAPGPATPAPTTPSGQPAPTPAATSNGRSRPTPAPTNGGVSGNQLPAAPTNGGASGDQVPAAPVTAPQGGGAGMSGVPPSSGFGNGNAFGAGLGATSAGRGIPANGGAFGGAIGNNPGFAGNGMSGFGGVNRMGAPGGGMFGGPVAGMGGGLNGNGGGGFGQPTGFRMQGGSTFGGFGGQGAMGNFGQAGNNGLAGAAGGRGQLGFGGAAPGGFGGGNALGGGFDRRERWRRRR